MVARLTVMKQSADIIRRLTGPRQALPGPRWVAIWSLAKYRGLAAGHRYSITKIHTVLLNLNYIKKKKQSSLNCCTYVHL
jgi:hypothetical protein